MNFQIVLNETSNNVDIIYDFPYVNATGTHEVGLRGSSSADFNNRTTSSNWNSTTAGGSNSASCSVSNTIFPASGLTFRWAPPSCIAPAGLSNTSVTSTTASHSWTAPNPAPAVGYEWAVTTSATPPASGTATTNTTASSTSLTANTTYYLHVRSECTAGVDFSAWTSASFFTGYCLFSGTVATSYFNAFSTTGGTSNITNTSSGYSATGYGNFTAQTVTQQQGGNVNFTTTLVGTTVGVAIWVDWNDNLQFETSERMYNSAGYVSSAAGTFTVPLSATVGTHRMRAVMDYNATSPSPCTLASGGRGEAEDYTFEVIASPPCSGAPTGVTITPATTTLCGSGSTTFTATTTSTGTGITYQWESSPDGTAWTPISGANNSTFGSGTVSSTTYYHCILTCSGTPTTSNNAVINIGVVPSNDVVCSAIALVENDSPICGNTTCATSSGDPSYSQSTPNNTVWYTFTPTVTGTYPVTMSRPTGITSGLLYGWLGIYTATGACPTLTLTEVSSILSFNLPTTPSVSLTTPILTAGITYYFMIDGFSSGFGEYCIRVESLPLPPTCVSNTSPGDLATNVLTIPNLVLTWPAAATATSYDVYIGTVNPPTALLANTTALTINVNGASANTTYYWYVKPKNAGGSATDCDLTNVTSFTTSPVCNPSTTNGGTSGDALIDFVLTGEGMSQISVLGSSAIPTPGYIDLSATTTVDLAAGKAYVGNFKAADANDYLTIWIDTDNNGGFEASEMVLSNLKPLGASTTTPYSFILPASISTGTHKMRVRTVYSSTAPSTPVEPCSNYTYGESKDFTINIVSGAGSAYTVSNVGGGVCASVARTTINTASNNASIVVPILDVTGAIVASVNANGNNLGEITSSVYRNTGAIRQNTPGILYILDRNITITPAIQPTSGTVDVKLYYSAAELTTLNGVNTGALSTNLVCDKTTATCSGTFSGTVTTLAHSGDGTLGSDYYLQVATPSFSTFYLRGPESITLNLTAYIEGFMNPTNTAMVPVLLNSGVVSATSTQCDTITVALHNISSPFAQVYTFKGIINTDGTVSCTFPSAASGNSYYVVVKHRNALDTWSANPVVFTATTNYSFASGAAQAFGSNLVSKGSFFAMYSGDIDGPLNNNQDDGTIDFFDYPDWETDYFNEVINMYRNSDFNGDGDVDFFDYPFWETNYFNEISVQKP